MGTLRLGLIGAAVAAAVLFAASDARAQSQIIELARIETVGGFTFYNDTATFWLEARQGRIARGFVRVDRRFRGGSQGTLVMTGRLDAARTLRLLANLQAAAPWRQPRVRDAVGNTDFPNTRVTFAGAITQEIVASYMTPPALPLVSRAMDAFRDEAWRIVSEVADAPFFVYEGSGGMLGYTRTITIAGDGKIVDEVTYANPHAPAQGYRKEGTLAPAEVMSLHALCAGWARYPAAFPGNPRAYDGIGIETTYTLWGASKTVFGGEPSARPASYAAVVAKVEALADALP